MVLRVLDQDAEQDGLVLALLRMTSGSSSERISPGSMLGSVFAHLAAASLGLLAGAMLLIAVAIVPYLTSLEPLEFARWFREHSPLLGRIMLPLGVSATVLALAAAALVPLLSSPQLPWLAAAAALAVAVAAVYPLYFTRANASLAGASLGPSEVSGELRRWRTWHWARTVAGTLAFLAALRALSLSGG